jgi:hypothetical protein
VTQYAVKVPFPLDRDGDMLYVTEGDSKFHLCPVLFDSRAAAEQHAKLWGEGALVVEYQEGTKRT